MTWPVDNQWVPGDTVAVEQFNGSVTSIRLDEDHYAPEDQGKAHWYASDDYGYRYAVLPNGIVEILILGGKEWVAFGRVVGSDVLNKMVRLHDDQPGDTTFPVEWNHQAATNPVTYHQEFQPLTAYELRLFDNLDERNRKIWRDRARNLNRRAVKVGEPGRVNGRELYALAQRYDDQCAYCDKPLNWGGGGTADLNTPGGIDERNHPQAMNDPAAGTFDHNHPLVQGGSGNVNNVVPACLNCNRDINKWDESLNPDIYVRPRYRPNPLAIEARPTEPEDSEDWTRQSGVKGDGGDVWGVGQIQFDNSDSPLGQDEVLCPNCKQETSLEVCPTCGKFLGPEWEKADDKSLPFDHPPQLGDSDFTESWTDVKAVPKFEPEKTDNSFPSMISRRTSVELTEDWTRLSADEPDPDLALISTY